MEQDIRKIEWVEETLLKLDAGNSKKYNIEGIWNNIVYRKESEKKDHLTVSTTWFYEMVGYFKKKILKNNH